MLLMGSGIDFPMENPRRILKTGIAGYAYTPRHIFGLCLVGFDLLHRL